jgi:hypothetical protein
MQIGPDRPLEMAEPQCYWGSGFFSVVSISTVLHVYKDIVSGKDFLPRELPAALKRRYIKGFQPSRCMNIALDFPSETLLKCLWNRCLPRALQFRHPIAELSNGALIVQTEAGKRHPSFPQ